MRVTVLRTLSLLISNVHHRILPEAAVRIPIERLIRLSHDIEDSSSNCRTKNELVKLIHAVFRQLLSYPALVNLFLENRRDPGTGKIDFHSVRFPLFSYLLEYMTTMDESTARVAREAISIGLRICATDERLATFIVDESHLGEMMVRLGSQRIRFISDCFRWNDSSFSIR